LGVGEFAKTFHNTLIGLMMDNETAINAYQRELHSAIVHKLPREKVEAIRAELAALGVKPDVETAGAGSAAKRTRKTAS
jgi:hypothetical protein